MLIELTAPKGPKSSQTFDSVTSGGKFETEMKTGTELRRREEYAAGGDEVDASENEMNRIKKRKLW